MAWSVFTQGGGDGAALTWAQQLLQALGAPVTPGDEQFIYDWEQSEGGGGKYNPLNQGPVPGQPQLTTTGSQYGGGAADYASYAAGIQGAVDYLNMSNYTAVKQALMNNDPQGARSALIASPWASSHYGYGAAFSNAPLPGQATSLLGGTATDASASTGSAESTNWLSDLLSGKPQGFSELFGGLFSGSTATSNIGSDIKQWLVRGSLILFGAIILIVGLLKMSGSNKTVMDVVTSPAAGAKTAAKGVKKVTGS